MLNDDSFRYFNREEFNCPCCGLNNTTDKHILMLDSAREIAGVPFIINSGSRCKKHNKFVGGKENSEHIAEGQECTGSDIRIHNSHERFVITMALIKVGFTRIGIGHEFIHVGNSETLPQNVEWIY